MNDLIQVVRKASAGGAVASVTGTADQVVVSPTTGATVVSLANPTLKDSGSSAAAWEERSNNTPAQTRWGTEEQSAGGVIFTGSTPNAAVFGSIGAHVVQWFYNNVLKATLNATTLNLAAGVTFQQNGTGMVQTDDARLSDARTPTAHASTHTTSGDLIATGTPDGTKFLRDDFAWAAPTATVAPLVGPLNLVNTVQAIAADTYVHVGRTLEIGSAGSIELSATSILEITP